MEIFILDFCQLSAIRELEACVCARIIGRYVGDVWVNHLSSELVTSNTKKRRPISKASELLPFTSLILKQLKVLLDYVKL